MPPPPEPRTEPAAAAETLLPISPVASEAASSRAGESAYRPNASAVEGGVPASSGGGQSSVGREGAVARVSPDSADGVTQVARPQGGYQVRPTYPATARRIGAQGTTILRVFVADDGRVVDVLVQESAGHADLDRAAADAVARWRFEPARRGAQAVGMWVLLPVQFQLR
jgi:protein TonB